MTAQEIETNLLDQCVLPDKSGLRYNPIAQAQIELREKLNALTNHDCNIVYRKRRLAMYKLIREKRAIMKAELIRFEAMRG